MGKPQLLEMSKSLSILDDVAEEEVVLPNFIPMW